MMNLASLLSVLAVAGFHWSSVDAFVPVVQKSSVAKPAFLVQSSSSSSLLAAAKSEYEFALLFDCDGVILETEELHRIAYNKAFEEFDLTIDGEPVVWSVEYYDILQNTVGGGKPKMFWYFRNTAGAFPNAGDKPVPETLEEQQSLIDDLQEFKTNHYKTLLATEAVARPGVIELMDEALADPKIAVGVCSAATKAAAVKTLDITLGPERVAKLDVCILGDDVSEKKPHPMIYNTARERLNMNADQCVVVEDSLVGLRAAVSADMKCVITYTSSTASADFYGEGASAKVPELGSAGVKLASIFGPLRENGLDSDILIGIKDEK